jgi:hypothetical protein
VLWYFNASTENNYNNFDLAAEDKHKLVKIIDDFDKYAIGQVNGTYERYNFNSRAQQDGNYWWLCR